jgi:hypothetical protein
LDKDKQKTPIKKLLGLKIINIIYYSDFISSNSTSDTSISDSETSPSLTLEYKS